MTGPPRSLCSLPPEGAAAILGAARRIAGAPTQITTTGRGLKAVGWAACRPPAMPHTQPMHGGRQAAHPTARPRIKRQPPRKLTVFHTRPAMCA
ncbi:MAG: hypothetical protein FHP94_18545 [Denitromonas halophila]|nr:MAG: hypothetical protein FHP94_18545 [Denitromonas halophila]TVT74463.1 MAG: hypothetical protein FHP93_03505 [Denitromonas halophila]